MSLRQVGVVVLIGMGLSILFIAFNTLHS